MAAEPAAREPERAAGGARIVVTCAFILDFDGVVADSEVLANTVLAHHVTNLGFPLSAERSLALYMGGRWPDVVERIARDTGAKLPQTFSEDVQHATLHAFEAELREVAGASRFIAAFQHVPMAIASSSSQARIAACLRILGLEAPFEGRVFSAEEVRLGKPAPDVFLLAAGRMGVDPADCLVVEDSVGGVEAAVRAGMTVIGLLAAAHIPSGHGAALRDVGATHVAASWSEASDLAAAFCEARRPSVATGDASVRSIQDPTPSTTF